MSEFKGTKEWYPLEFAGFFILKDAPYYESNSIFDAEHVGIETAKANIKLASKAPEMLSLLLEIVENYYNEKHPTISFINEIENLIKEATQI